MVKILKINLAFSSFTLKNLTTVKDSVLRSLRFHAVYRCKDKTYHQHIAYGSLQKDLYSYWAINLRDVLWKDEQEQERMESP